MDECHPVLLEESPGYLNNAIQLAMTTAIRILGMTPQEVAKDPDTTDSKDASTSLTNGSTSPLREITLDEVSWHDRMDDCWIVIYDRVYDITEFLQEHPGGADILFEYAGRDATLAYRGFGHSAQAWQILQQYLIGMLPERERSQIFTQCELGVNFRLKAVS